MWKPILQGKMLHNTLYTSHLSLKTQTLHLLLQKRMKRKEYSMLQMVPERWVFLKNRCFMQPCNSAVSKVIFTPGGREGDPSPLRSVL